MSSWETKAKGFAEDRGGAAGGDCDRYHGWWCVHAWELGDAGDEGRSMRGVVGSGEMEVWESRVRMKFRCGSVIFERGNIRDMSSEFTATGCF